MNSIEQQGYDDHLFKGIKAKNPYRTEEERTLWQKGYDEYVRTLGETRYATKTEIYEFEDERPYIVGYVWHSDERYDMK